jgi:glycosyltransferase involved in cell wall biosynthesis
MSDSHSCHHHVESPAAGATVPAGHTLIRGWLWPKPGEHCVDVRAQVGGQIFPGIHGFPRADLAAHFATGQRHALAEFTIAVTLPPGPAEISLAALSIDGDWRPFHTLQLHVEGPVAPSAPADEPPLRWHEYGRVLQSLLRSQRRHPDAALRDLANAVVGSLPMPRNLRHAHLPFHGHLDEPAAMTRCGFGRTAVLGWLFHETLPIKRVLATFDLQAWQTIAHGLASPGPAAHFPHCPNAAPAGLFGIIDVPAQLPQPVTLRLYAELDDGSLHLCCVQRSRLFANENEKAPYPPHHSDTFAHATAALDAALAERGLGLTRDAELAQEIARLRDDFDLRAPLVIPEIKPLIPAPPSAATFPPRVLLVTHNLNLEGAPLFLLDYAAHLAGLGCRLTALSPADGPLRARLAGLGASIALCDTGAVFAAKNESTARAAITGISASFDFSAYDLVVCNTFTTFWAVHAAKAADRRVVLYVHESTTPASFYVGRVAPSVIALANEAFGLADAVSFTTASTRGYHLDYGRPERHYLTPGWIDVARIDAWRSAHAKESLRAGFNLQEHELLVTNIGTVCDRKGQHIFARAVDLFTKRYPALARRTRFVLLGGGDTPFDQVLNDLLAHLQLARLEVHPATADYFPYFGAADLFVCSTYEESSPRVILEAMAFQTPILSSGVHGVPEQVTDGLEASLVPPGDTVALCDAMARMLACPEIGHDLAARARARVLREFEAAILLPRHAALAAAVAGAKA